MGFKAGDRLIWDDGILKRSVMLTGIWHEDMGYIVGHVENTRETVLVTENNVGEFRKIN